MKWENNEIEIVIANDITSLFHFKKLEFIIFDSLDFEFNNFKKLIVKNDPKEICIFFNFLDRKSKT